MLTGKKIGAVCFVGIFIVCLLASFYPNLSRADISATQRADNDYLAAIKIQYQKDPTKHTFDLPSGKQYVITDGKDYLIFQKGNPDPPQGTTIERDASKDILIGVGTSNGTLTRVTSQPTNADPEAQKAAVNAIAQQQGDNIDIPGLTVWDTVMSKNDSILNNQAGVDQQKNLQDQIYELEQQKQELIDAGLDTSYIDQQLADKTSQYDTLRGNNLSNVANRAKSPPPQPAEEVYCIKGGFAGIGLKFNWPGCAAIGANWLMKIAAFFLWVSALLFDLTLSYTLNIKPLVSDLKVIDIGWSIFRDVSNIFFIFLLLISAIGTIIGNSTYSAKSMIPKILMAAVLINFSLFFTKVVIDASNIVALEFYANMGGKTSDFKTTFSDSNAQATGIAAIFLDSMNLKNLYTISTTDNANAQTGAITTGGGASVQGLSTTNIALVGLGGTILFLVTAFVLFAGTVLFLIRTIYLIMLMITSPIGILANAVPGGKIKKYGTDWWDALFKQAFFAPVYMAIMYVAVVAVKSLGTATKAGGGSWADMFNGQSSKINIVFTFIMIIGFMIAALVSASNAGAIGSKAFVGTGKKIGSNVGNWAVRNTAGSVVGQLGYRYSNSRLGTFLASNKITGALGGGALLRGAAGMTNVKIGGKNYQERIKDEVKKTSDTAKLIRDRSVLRRFNESDEAYNKRVEKEKGFDKEKERNYLGVGEKGESTSAFGFLGGTLSRRTAIEQVRKAYRDKLSKKSKKEVNADTLKVWLGKNADGKHNDDIDKPLPGSELEKLREKITNKAKEVDSASTGSDKKMREDELRALRQKESRMVNKLDKMIDDMKVSEENQLSEIKEALKENSKK